MIQGISNWFLKIYKSRSNLDYDDEIFIYGIEVMITSLLNIFLLLFIGIISGEINTKLLYINKARHKRDMMNLSLNKDKFNYL